MALRQLRIRLSTLRGYVWPQTEKHLSKPKRAAMRRFISSIFPPSPSKRSIKLASVPVVPRQPRKRIVPSTKSNSSRSARKSCIQSAARLPIVTGWAG